VRPTDNDEGGSGGARAKRLGPWSTHTHTTSEARPVKQALGEREIDRRRFVLISSGGRSRNRSKEGLLR
jgi:hypothetical protein